MSNYQLLENKAIFNHRDTMCTYICPTSLSVSWLSFYSE